LGNAAFFEGVEPIGWFPSPDDLIIIVESEITRKEIIILIGLPNRIGKNAFYSIDWGPRGLPEIIVSAIYFTIEQAAGYIFQKVLDEILKTDIPLSHYQLTI
jgi:hypothetical protein